MWPADYLKQDPIWESTVNNVYTEAEKVLQNTPYAALLNKLALIKISGEDAETFLQGQVTCDFKAVAQQQVKLGAHCNAKGRAQTSFIAFSAQGDFYLALKSNQVEPTLEALNKFALFSKVTLSQCDDWLPLALGGAGIEDVIGETFGQPPEAGQSISSGDHIILHLAELGYLAFINPSRAETTINALKSGSSLCSDPAWQLALINSGISLIAAEVSEQWIPQEFNYDLVGGISFDKGCYKGQEIIARIHYRGQTKIRAHILEIEFNAPLSEAVRAGDKVIGGAQTGCILEVAPVNERTIRALCTLKTTDSESENLKLEQNDDCQIRVLPLPYAIT